AGTTSGLDFAYTGFDAFSGLGAGATTGALGISFGNTGALGTYDDLITLSGIGSNASGFSAAVSDVTLQGRVSVVQGGGTVPLPSSVLLLTAGLLPMLGAMRAAARRRLH
ncbi:MAG TPA: hypothetical protein PKC20_19290, partial [Burkholderiaceae bacterium]|nr:hypothetical protein [Burkholderiaceae bacterium]